MCLKSIVNPKQKLEMCIAASPNFLESESESKTERESESERCLTWSFAQRHAHNSSHVYLRSKHVHCHP